MRLGLLAGVGVLKSKNPLTGGMRLSRGWGIFIRVKSCEFFTAILLEIVLVIGVLPHYPFTIRIVLNKPNHKGGGVNFLGKH